MRIPDCLARTIPVRLSKLAKLSLVLALALSVSEGAPVRGSAAKRRAAAKRATSRKPAATAPRPVPVRPANSALAGLVRAYRESPSPARRAAIQTYAASHPNERDLAKLALGITAWEQKEY